MLMPSIFGRDLFDDFCGYPYSGHGTDNVMKTDVRETEQGYELTMDMPGVKKEDVKAELKDGYLTITAVSRSENDEKDDKGKYIRRERHYGTTARSFYVGDNITEEDIKARFENGTLKLFVPKKDNKPAVDDKKYIAIEG